MSKAETKTCPPPPPSVSLMSPEAFGWLGRAKNRPSPALKKLNLRGEYLLWLHGEQFCWRDEQNSGPSHGDDVTDEFHGRRLIVLPKWLEGGLRGRPRSRESSMDQHKNTMDNNQDDASPTELSKSGPDGGWGSWTPSYQMRTVGFGGATPIWDCGRRHTKCARLGLVAPLPHEHITHGCS
ncbi:hypothetical protein MUK42_10409 [Musa troglodytarum]|uniref:Uncharacterized protein n=1 Tax=Musa troglodytarum TaxID=320322 RepID=A0A9E7EKU9_9LILI|nr:hypothetical protein MUK42_10409 [Musa troglodytarum]